MAKKAAKKIKTASVKHVISVVVARLFPSSDPIAVDLLRLMCGCSDLYHVTKWFAGATQRSRTNFAARHIANGRMMLQLRLSIAFLYECLSVIRDLTKRPGFEDLRSALDNAGTESLVELERIKLSGVGFTDADWGVDEAIRRTRHTTTFHYDCDQITQRLAAWVQEHGSNEKGYIMIEQQRNGREGLPYYSVADVIRADIAFGINNAQHFANVVTITRLLECLTRLVQSLMFAYAEKHGLTDCIQAEDSLKVNTPGVWDR